MMRKKGCGRVALPYCRILQPYPPSWYLECHPCFRVWRTHIFVPPMLGLAMLLALTKAMWAKVPVPSSGLNGHCGFLLAPPEPL